jgi:hypothetical protein
MYLIKYSLELSALYVGLQHIPMVAQQETVVHFRTQLAHILPHQHQKMADPLAVLIHLELTLQQRTFVNTVSQTDYLQLQNII